MLFIIVVSALRNYQLFILKGINEPMFLADPPAPESAPLEFQRFRLSNAIKGISQNIFDQSIYASNNLPIVVLPIKVILPCLNVPANHFD
jgi:hypothetical protein